MTVSYFMFLKKKYSENGPSHLYFFKILNCRYNFFSSLTLFIVSQCGFNPNIAILGILPIFDL